MLMPANIDRIIETVEARQESGKFAHLATPEEIAETAKPQHPALCRYVREEEEIDLAAVQARLTRWIRNWQKPALACVTI